VVSQHWIGVAKSWQLTTSNPLEQLVSLTPKHLATHLLAIGGSGSGKTTLLQHLLMQDIERHHSTVLLDLRGDLAESVINICAAGGVDPSRISLLDLREQSRPTGFNPLYGAGDPYFRALNVLSVLKDESESWGVQLEESLQSALLLLSEAGEPLTRLEDLFYETDFLAACLEHSHTQSVIRFWDRYQALSPDRRAAMIWPVVNKLSPLLSTETLRKVVGHPKPLDIGAHLNQPGRILLISLAVDELHGAARMLGSLLLSSISREIFARVKDSGSIRNPVRLYVDEFEHFVADFETILAEGRRFGLSLVLAHQTLAQLSPKMRSLILNNVGVKFVFRCGREDGPHLSRDLTGDPHTLDFNDLPPGEALMWVRGFAPEVIEINEPLQAIQRTGHTTAYRHALVSRGELVELPVHSRRHKSPAMPGNQANADRRRTSALPSHQKALEEWLCGS
jgi:hypothetical protein